MLIHTKINKREWVAGYRSSRKCGLLELVIEHKWKKYDKVIIYVPKCIEAGDRLAQLPI